MNGATFRLYREAMGYENKDVAHMLDVNPRTVNRWESGVFQIPVDVVLWIEGQWSAFLDRIDRFVEEVENFPSGMEVELSTYKNQESLDRAGGRDTLGQADATNRALAVVLALADLVPVASVVPVED